MLHFGTTASHHLRLLFNITDIYRYAPPHLIGEKLNNSGETTPVTVRLIHELENYRGMVPVLKYVRGEAFSDKHWIEMYNLLGIPSSTTIDKLTFGNFLQVMIESVLPY